MECCKKGVTYEIDVSQIGMFVRSTLDNLRVRLYPESGARRQYPYWKRTKLKLLTRWKCALSKTVLPSERLAAFSSSDVLRKSWRANRTGKFPPNFKSRSACWRCHGGFLVTCFTEFKDWFGNYRLSICRKWPTTRTWSGWRTVLPFSPKMFYYESVICIKIYSHSLSRNYEIIIKDVFQFSLELTHWLVNLQFVGNCFVHLLLTVDW